MGHADNAHDLYVTSSTDLVDTDKGVPGNQRMRIGRNDPCLCGCGRKYKHCQSVPANHRPDTDASRGAPAPAAAARKRRQCSGCAACCGPALRINTADLFVPKGETCPHLREHGCALWGPSLPAVCRGFLCNYLTEPVPLTIQERPDKAGAIVKRTEYKQTRLHECASEGLFRILRNPFWGPMIQRDLLQDRFIIVSFLDDPNNADSICVKAIGGRLKCELTSCHEDGSPILVPAQRVHGTPVQDVLFLDNQNFRFDVEELIGNLAGHPLLVLTPPVVEDPSQRISFRFSRRQADFLGALLRTMRLGHQATSQHSAPSCVMHL
jgi:hypothetical protein